MFIALSKRFRSMTSDINEKLQRAVIEGDLEQVKALIDAGADVNYRSKDHRDTALHYASTPEIVNMLLLNKADVNIADRYGQTPLCCAVAKRDSVEVVKILITAGASVNVRMARGNTPLHYAPTVELHKLLLQNGAIVNATDSYGRAPIHSALIDGKGVEVVRTLLSAGADVNVQIGTFQNSLLHYTDSLEITRELLSRGIDVNIMTNRRQTPLHYAVKQLKEVAIVRELLKNGANPNGRDIERNTALVYAIRSHWIKMDVIKELLEYGAFINEVYFDFTTRRFCTVMDNAIIHDLPCAKLMVKIYLIKCHKEGETIDVDPDIPLDKIKDFASFIDNCIDEIYNMKMDRIISNLTYYELVVKKENVKPLYSSYRTLEKEISSKYPIYSDIILPQIMLGLERGLLLGKFRVLQLSTKSILHDQNRTENEVILNPDCTHMIAELLSDDDLRNLLIAFELDSPS